MDPNKVPDYCIIKCSLHYDAPEPSLLQINSHTIFGLRSPVCLQGGTVRYDFWSNAAGSERSGRESQFPVKDGNVLTAAPLSLRVKQSQKESNT